jgi:drug/metabolite transporter (DMT)-like permease
MSTPLETLLGILLALLAAAMFTFGALFQKKGVQDLPDIKMSDIKTMTPMLKSKIWVIGVIVGTAGGAPYILSQSYIGIGYTQLLLASGLILLAYMASRMLHEPLGKIEYSGIAVIVAGSICLGLVQLQDISESLFLDATFIKNAIIFYIIFGSLIAVGLILYKITNWGVAKNLAINSGIWFGIGACSSQIGTLGLETWNLLIVAFGFGILLAGNTIGTIVVNIAFQKGKAIMVIPLQAAGNYLIPVFAGLWLFQQTFKSGIWLWPAIILIMVGVLLLSRIQAEVETSMKVSEPKVEEPSPTTEPDNSP